MYACACVSSSEHLAQLQHEQAEIQKSLGKGKRIRKRINYAETALMELMPQKVRVRSDVIASVGGGCTGQREGETISKIAISCTCTS